MTTEQEARREVKALKQFYMDLVTYVSVNGMLILIWLVFDRAGSFWPKYVLVVWGLVLLFKIYRRKIIPFVYQYVGFLSPRWEDKKVKEILGKKLKPRKAPIKKARKKKTPSR